MKRNQSLHVGDRQPPAAEAVKRASLDSAWQEYLAEHDIETDEGLRYVRKAFDLLRNNILARLPPVQRGPEEQERWWETLLLPTDQALRTFNKAKVMVTRNTQKQAWFLVMTLNSNRQRFQEHNSLRLSAPYSLISQDNQSPAKRVAVEVCDILNRWKFPDMTTYN